MISSARLMDRLRLTEPLDEPHLQELVDAAIAYIEGRTGRYFGPVTETTEYLRGTGTPSLYLRSLPTTAETANEITVTEQKRPGGTLTTLDDGDFTLRRGRRVASLDRASGVWLLGYEYVVSFSHGYAVDALPADIEKLVLFLVKRDFAAFDAKQVKSRSIGPITTTYFGADHDLSEDEQKKLLESWGGMVFA